MRRKDREVTDFDEIVSIIDECDILRLGLIDGGLAYIVPINFAYTVNDGQIRFYIHGAMAGKKYELLRSTPTCSFEMDKGLKIECFADRGAVTMRYKSVMGKAEVRFLDGEQKRRAIEDILLARYEITKNFDYDRAVIDRTAVIELTVTEISAKANL